MKQENTKSKIGNPKSQSEKSLRFADKIDIIGVNPFVRVPDRVLKELFRQAGKDKGPIPVKGKLNGKPFVQTVVKYRGMWRLYLNARCGKRRGWTSAILPR